MKNWNYLMFTVKYSFLLSLLNLLFPAEMVFFVLSRNRCNTESVILKPTIQWRFLDTQCWAGSPLSSSRTPSPPQRRPWTALPLSPASGDLYPMLLLTVSSLLMLHVSRVIQYLTCTWHFSLMQCFRLTDSVTCQTRLPGQG